MVPSNELIYKAKRNYRRDLTDFMANELFMSIAALIPDYSEYVITSVPRARRRVVKYGYDHSEALARALALRLGIQYVKVLRSKQTSAQKLSESKEARISNARFDYANNNDLPSQKLFLVDDIVTSGASMGNCAMLLRGKDAKVIVGVCLGIAFKDKYVPFAKDPYGAR